MKERYIACFGEDFKNSYLKYLDKIRKYVSKCNNLFTINVYDLEIEDLVKKCNDKDYLNDKNISFIHNGIEIIVPLEDFWSDIKNYIPKSVTRLELPSSFIENDIMFFSDFLNLETLVVSDHGRLSTDIIKLIEENTNIKTIYSRGVIWGVYDFANEEGFTALDTPYKCCVYKDILYRNINEPDIDINNYFKPSIAISSYDLYVSAIERLYTIADDRLKDKVTVETMDCYYEIEFDKEKKSYNIKVKSDDVSYVSRIVNYMSNKGISVDSVLWKMKDKNYYDKDLSCLEDISKKVELSINYGDYLDASYEEFRGLLESVKWYRKIISDSNLSSVEKVMFAFDILKTFRYNESEEDKEDSRYAHRIIETGNIVCLGYSNLLVQILNYLDNNIRVIEFGLDCYDENKSFLGGHSRCLVKLDDDKYNIHGIFALDATWDSDKSHVISSDFASDYTALDLYRYFLVPAKDYEKIFTGDTLPHLFKCYLGYDFNLFMMNDEYRTLFDTKYCGNYFGNDPCPKNNNNEVKTPFGDVIFTTNKSSNDKDNTNDDSDKIRVDNELKRYLSTLRPCLEKFSEILVNVRMAEGYSKGDAVKEVEKVIRINKKIVENMNSVGNDIEFFKEEKGVSRQ